MDTFKFTNPCPFSMSAANVNYTSREAIGLFHKHYSCQDLLSNKQIESQKVSDFCLSAFDCSFAVPWSLPYAVLVFDYIIFIIFIVLSQNFKKSRVSLMSFTMKRGFVQGDFIYCVLLLFLSLTALVYCFSFLSAIPLGVRIISVSGAQNSTTASSIGRSARLLLS